MTALTLPERLRDVEGSPTLALAAKAKALANAGKPVLDFTAGEPDFPTPDPVKRAGIRAIESNQTRYTPVAGLPELRAAVAQQVNRTRHTNYSAAHVLVSCGAKHALFNVFQALCQPGDEVILLSPYWVSFPALVRLAGAKPVIVPTQEADGFQPDLAAIRNAISGATKALVINSPSNPTGAVVSKARLEALAALALERHLVVISDEIYDELVYPPAAHRSITQLNPQMADCTVLIGGVSKTYSMTGWRIGWAVGPEPLVEAMTTLQSHSTSNPTSISQHAALAALTGEQSSVAAMRKEFLARRDRLVQGLAALPGLRVKTPEGAFYAWCNVRGLGQSAQATAQQWLDEALVATVPGEGFGSSEHIRFSFATSLQTIDDALRRLDSWCRKRSS